MRTSGNNIILTDCGNISLNHRSISYVDEEGTRIVVPHKLLVHLHDMLKFDIEKNGIDFNKYCERLFEEKL